MIGPLCRVRRWRDPINIWWGRGHAEWILRWLRWFGGASFDVEAEVPDRSGELVLVNHQSLLDIPLIYTVVQNGYPRTVARALYFKGVPLVSWMLRHQRHLPVVQGDHTKEQMRALRDFARNAQHPVVVFPEGHRTRTGELLPWKTAGLKMILAQRQWRISVVLIDGLWEVVSLPQFSRNISSTRGVVRLVSTHEFDPKSGNADELLARMEAEMCAKLVEIRRGTGAADELKGSTVVQRESGA